VVSTPLENLSEDSVLAAASAPPKQPNKNFDCDIDSALGMKDPSLAADYQKVMNDDEARPSALPEIDHALVCHEYVQGVTLHFFCLQHASC
jgi:hypothetical protein